MTKSKLSVTLDPETLNRARALVNVGSVSELLDVALERLIQTELERQHIAGYVRIPAGDEFVDFANIPRHPIADDVDWAALYDEEN
jgi:post-segregation antitoxin (ccd killing protein)